MKRLLLLILLLFFVLQYRGFAEHSVTMPDGRKIVDLNGSTYRIFLSDTTLLVNNVFFVKYDSLLTDTDIADIESGYDFDSAYVFLTGWRAYYLPEMTDLVDLTDEFLQKPGVVNIDFNFGMEFFSSATPNDPLYDHQWYIEDISIPDVWDNYTTGNSTVLVGILDQGTDWFNPDFGADNGLGRNFVHPSQSTNTHAYHGTMLHSIIAALTNNETGTAGIAGGWNSLPITTVHCVVGDDLALAGNSVRAIDYCLSIGVRLFNFSWGFPAGPDCSYNNINYLLLNEIKLAYDRYGAIMFGATGNSSYEEVAWPACTPWVIAVGASDQNHKIWEESGPSGSSWGINTDISAPGTEIYHPTPTMGPTIPPEYVETSSTSGATAVASGVAALLLSVNPCLNGEDMFDILKQTAHKTGGYNYNNPASMPGHSLELGYGILNAADAMAVVSDASTVIAEGQNITFNEPKWFTQDLTVERGGSLTISTTVKFTEGKHIIVEKGGRLVVDHGILTSTCPTWGGIIVEGDQNLSQSPPSNQGFVSIAHNSKIENAQIGIESRNGGIVYADSSSFVNNLHSIVIADYPNKKNFSTIKRCNFEWKSDYYHPYLNPVFIGNQYFIGIEEVMPIKIAGCSFINKLVKDDQSFEYRGYGVICHNGSAVITEYSPDNSVPLGSGLQNHFKDLKYGVVGLSSAGFTSSVVVSHAYFENNLNGLYASGYNDLSYIKVFLNKFRTLNFFDGSQPDPIGAPYYSYGLYLNNCSGYTVDENEFCHYITNDPYFEKMGYGLIINESGTRDNLVYNNKFHGLAYGAQAQNCNRGPIFNPTTPSSGLCFICNDFNDNINDIEVLAETYPPIENQGIATFQGDNIYPANNTFSSESTGGINYFNDLAPFVPMNYFIPQVYNGSIYKLNPNPSSGLSKFVSPNTTYNKWDDCPSSFSSTKSIAELQAEYAESKSEKDSLVDLLNTIVDGGNTTELADEVNYSVPTEAFQIYSELLAQSPFLSDSVIKAAVYKETVLTNALLRDVLVENPQAPKSGEIMEALEQRFIPMPDSMMVQIEGGLDVMGAKEEQESQLTRWNLKAAATLRDLIQFYSEDTTGIYTPDSLLTLISGENTLASLYNQVNHLFNTGLFSAGLNLLNTIPTQFSLSASEAEVYERYNQLFPIVHALIVSGTAFTGLDSAAVSGLFELASKDADLPGAYARNLLVMNGLLDYHEPILLPSALKETPVRHTYDPSHRDYSEYQLRVFPNPAKTYFTIEYSTVKARPETEQILISLSDLKGHVLETLAADRLYNQVIVPTTNLPDGTYLVTLLENGIQNASSKVTIIK